MMPRNHSHTRQRIPSGTLWRMGLAGMAGLWLGRRIPVGVVAAAAAAWLLTRGQQPAWTRPRPLAAPDATPHDGPWPEAPEAEPFVPHTRAWDELREAIAPVLHTPEPEPEPPKSQFPDPALLHMESFAFEATEPFIIDDEDAGPPKR